MVSAVSVICFLVCFCILHQFAQSRSTRQARKRVPFETSCSRTCRKTRDQQPFDEDFPPYPCSCSQSCSTFGDCCYDAPYRSTERVSRKTKFICLSIASHGRYRAISSCPADRQSDFCKDGLGNQRPVTSRKTNATYANMFCAICNGDGEDLITWNVELRCPPDEEGHPPTQHAYLRGDFWGLNNAGDVGRRCEYHVHFNDSSFMERVELRSCDRPRKISHCSSSWKDTSVARLCRSYEDPVYYEDKLYRNLHCAQCNYRKQELAECLPANLKALLQEDEDRPDSDATFCRVRGYDACIQMYESRKGLPYTFGDLIRISETRCVPPKWRRCCQGEALDIMTGECKNVEYD